MGLFEEAGRRFERFKQDARAAAEETATEDTADYECTGCGAQLHEAADRCPKCKSTEVVHVDQGDDSQSASDGETHDDGTADRNR